MNYDRQIKISVGSSRNDINWKRQILTVSELYDRLKVPGRGAETIAEYSRLSKAQQGALKDVGGFVAGELSGPRRKSNAVLGRDVITLDFDNIPGWATDSVIGKLDALGCNYCVYSTRKHTPNAPRLRVLVPTDRTMSPDEYEPCARYLASIIGIDMADPTTFEVARLMYWPSCCADSEYVYKTCDAPFANVDHILGTYPDWHDVNQWPQVPGSFNYKKLAVKQGDPETKPGIVGAFCRVYDIYRAMDELIPGIYDEVASDDDRFTYTGGSTTGGAVVYDSGKFLYSHHATDPCSGRLVNSFDMVRLHKYGDLDGGCDDMLTPTNRLPSFKAMCEYANSLNEVALRMMLDRQKAAVDDFKGVAVNTSIGANESATDGQESPTGPSNGAANELAESEWMLKIQREPKSGKIKGTIDNILIILNNHPELKDRFALNQFAGRGEVLGVLPWSTNGTEPRRRMWSDTDSNGLYWFMEKNFEITSRGNIDAALDIHAATHAFNDVQNYINGLIWDGQPRLDTLFIDYLGADDSLYVRTVTRKAFTAAVARAMNPGCKFDNMLILCGPQGIGKSTILDKMSRGFFNDSIHTFEGKEASELLQGVWIVEVAELDAFRRSDVACIKQFLSLRADRYRAAYGRHVKELPRCCVFFGTCNQSDFLQDTTGNRRFWPVDVGRNPREKSVFDDLTDDVIAQVWAEAKARWQAGEPLYISGEVEQEARERQEDHREASAQEGVILEFVSRQVPDDWLKWTLDKRRDFWNGCAAGGSYTLVERNRICAAEVWCELYCKNISDIRKQDVRDINAVLDRMEGWERKVMKFGSAYGCAQRGFKKIN